MKLFHMVSFLLVVVGAINWGLVGLLGINVVNILFGTVPSVEKLVYVLVGAAGVVILLTHKSDCKICGGKK